MRDGKYTSLDQLECDVDLMCRNTQEYNIEGSQIYEDSVTLWNVFSSAKQRLLEHEAQLAREAGKEKAHQHHHKEKDVSNVDEDEDAMDKTNNDDGGATNDADMNPDESDDDGSRNLNIFENLFALFCVEF